MYHDDGIYSLLHTIKLGFIFINQCAFYSTIDYTKIAKHSNILTPLDGFKSIQN